MNCPICKSELIDSFGLFCPNEDCCFITEIQNIVNEEDIIPLLYEDKKLVKWIKIYDNVKRWYLNGKHHREDGPACEYFDGSKEWWLNGQLHREDGPAIEFADGTKYWYVNGRCHREDAAIEYSNGSK